MNNLAANIHYLRQPTDTKVDIFSPIVQPKLVAHFMRRRCCWLTVFDVASVRKFVKLKLGEGAHTEIKVITCV